MWRITKTALGCITLCLALAVCRAPQPDSYDQEIVIALDRVSAVSPVLVGSFDFDGGALYYKVSAGAGSGLFVGLYQEPRLPDPPVTWERYMEGIFPLIGDEKSIDVAEGVGDLAGTYYLYIGSSDTDLSDVIGTVSYQPADSQ